jgi:hypothetical protein
VVPSRCEVSAQRHSMVEAGSVMALATKSASMLLGIPTSRDVILGKRL